MLLTVDSDGGKFSWNYVCLCEDTVLVDMVSFNQSLPST